MIHNRLGIVLGLAACLHASTAAAQSTTVLVSVADAESGRPLEGAQVRVPDQGRVGRADWLGEARLANVARGPHALQVRAMGYAPSDITVDVTGDSVGVVFMLQRVANRLDTVRVFAPAVPQRLEAFETRRRMAIGRFLTDSVLEKEGNRSLASVLVSHLPGLRLVADTPATFMTIVATGTSGSAWDFNSIATGTCKVDVYLDGFPLIDHLESVFTSDLAGVELYDMASAPPQYRQSSPMGAAAAGRSTRFASCKVLLLWTRW